MPTPWKESYNQLSILKSRDIILPTKVRLVKAVVFPVVMYGCESWTVKKAECLRIDAFELWCWRRLLRVPWTARRSNQSILKEISPGCSLEGLMLKLKLQYFGQMIRRADSFEKTLCWERLKAGREGDDRGWDGWMASLAQCIWVWINSRSWWWTGKPGMLQFTGPQRVGQDWTSEQNWTAGKESPCHVGDLGSIPGLRRSPGYGKGYPVQYSGLENSMDCIVHGVAEGCTWLSNFQFHIKPVDCFA